MLVEGLKTVETFKLKNQSTYELRQTFRTNLGIKQKHIDSHEFATPSEVHGLQEAEQPDLNGGGASSGLQIEKDDVIAALAIFRI